jgi:hypothetical protein
MENVVIDYLINGLFVLLMYFSPQIRYDFHLGSIKYLSIDQGIHIFIVPIILSLQKRFEVNIQFFCGRQFFYILPFLIMNLFYQLTLIIFKLINLLF